MTTYRAQFLVFDDCPQTCLLTSFETHDRSFFNKDCIETKYFEIDSH